MSLMYLAPGILNAVFSAFEYYIQVIWLFYWKMMFPLFGAGFWSLVGTVRDYVPFRRHIFGTNSGYPDFVPNITYQFNFVPPFFDMLKKTLLYCAELA